jgi:ankyrin repeat protein
MAFPGLNLTVCSTMKKSLLEVGQGVAVGIVIGLIGVSLLTAYSPKEQSDKDQSAGKSDTKQSASGVALQDELIMAVGASGDLNLAAIREILNRGADPDLPNEDGDIALIAATKKGSIKTVELLINHGASLDVTESKGDTALLVAIKTGKADIARLLMKLRANADIVNVHGESASMLLSDKSKSSLLSDSTRSELRKAIIDRLPGQDYSAFKEFWSKQREQELELQRTERQRHERVRRQRN